MKLFGRNKGYDEEQEELDFIDIEETDEDIEYEESEYETDEDIEYEESEYETDEDIEYEESEYEADETIEYEESEYETDEDIEYEESEYETDEDIEYEESEYETDEDIEYEESEYETDDGIACGTQEVSMDTVGLEPILMEAFDEEEISPKAKKRNSGTKRKTKNKKQKQHREEKNFFMMMLDKFNGVPAVDRILVSTGALVLVLAIVTGSVYVNAKAIDAQVAAFYETGENLGQVGIIGESGLLAVSDAKLAMSNEVVEEGDAFDAEAEVEVDENDAVELNLNMTSVEKDLKIKIVNKKTKKLVSNIAFKVEVTGPDKKTLNWEDDDKDGIIYKQNLTPGSYKVALVNTDELSEFIVPAEAGSVTVKDKIVYQKIDVTDEVKTESQVNAAVEDTQQKLADSAPALKDTVEYVESTKTAVNGSGGSGSGSEYEKISHSDITDPLTLTSVVKYWKFAEKQPQPITVTQTGSEQQTTLPDPTETPTEQPKPSEPSTEQPKPSEPSTEKPTPEPTPDQKVTGVKVSSTKGSLAKDETATVTIETQYSGGSGALPSTEYSWSTTPTGVLEISGSGVSVTAKAKAVSTDTTVKVTGTETKSGKSATVEITVKKEVLAVTVGLTANPTTIKVGETTVIKANTSDSQGVTWDGLPAGLSQVSVSDSELKVKADKTGSYTIKATSKSDTTKTATCPVTVSASNIKLSFSEGSKELRIGNTLKAGELLKIENKPADKNVEWSSSKTDIAAVGSDGVITAKAVGETVVTAKLGDVSATFTVKVLGSDISVKLDREKGVAYTESDLTLKATVTNGAKGDTFEWITSDSKKATVKPASDGLSAVITGVKEGDVKITVRVTASGGKKTEATCKLTVKLNPKKDKTTKLKDKDGKQVYVKNSKGEYVEAIYADFYTGEKLYKKLENVTYKYTGWQTLDGKTYFFNKDGDPVKGEQIIQGAKYVFDSEGVLQKSSGTLGIDVSKWNGDINWPAVKNSGVSSVIIRCGYRGSKTGALIQDPTFKKNIQGATAAGLKVGIYFFSQAVNEVEAVEEASMVLSLIKGYKISYPVFTDIEGSGGRGDLIDKNTRTNVANAFCQTIKNGGYTPGVYANKNWFETKMNTASLTQYKLWLAQYAAEPTYKATKYDMWQYSSKGRVNGISGNVDMNKSYLGY